MSNVFIYVQLVLLISTNKLPLGLRVANKLLVWSVHLWCFHCLRSDVVIFQRPPGPLSNLLQIKKLH